MSTFLSKALRAAGTPLRVVRRRPLTSTAVLVLLLAGGLFAGWRYAVAQWHEAEAAVREERVQVAQQKLDFCRKVWPYSHEVELLSARTARWSGDIKSAEAHLNRCLELNGGATDDIQREFLLLRVQAGQVDELAPALFNLVNSNHPDSREILNTIASAYIVRLRYKPAYACVNKWVEVEPGYAKPYYLRALVLERLNNQKAASEDYHKALQIDPDMVPARLRIAEMLLEDKQAPEALPHLERLRELAPDDPQVKARMGICLFLQGRGPEARVLMEEAVVHLPKDPALLVTLANLELQDGQPAKAEARLREVLAKDPSDTEALFVLVSALQVQGRAEEATNALVDYEEKKGVVEKINTFLRDRADDPSATVDEFAEAGILFLRIKRDRLGVQWLERALERDPGSQPAHRALAEHFERKGNADAAAAHRRHLRSDGPREPNTATGSQTPGGKSP
jgi:tetratricopeptide (TPR) repeat protein